MEFMELTEDEVTMLSESEKKQYNKERMLYQERVAFVEKLEQIENADFQYQKPEIKRIKPICRIDIPKYKAVSVTPLSLPKNLIRRKDFRNRANAQFSLNDKIRARISCKYKLSNVLGTKRKIETPILKIKLAGNKEITNIPSKKKTTVPSVSFHYEGKPIMVTPVKAKLPRTIKFTGIEAVKIKNIQIASINETTKKKHNYSQKNNHANFNVRSKAMQAFRIQDVPKTRVYKIDTSEISEHIERIAIERINLKNCMAVIPTAPSSKKYTVPACEVTISQIEKVLIPTLKDYKTPILNATVDDIVQPINVSTPVFHHLQLPQMDGVKDVVPQKVRLLDCSIGDIEYSVITDVPTLSIPLPDYTEEDVNNVLDRIMKVIKGA